MTDITPIGGEARANDINNNGQVVSMANGRPFLYSEGSMTLLGSSSNAAQEANAINNKGDVVGYMTPLGSEGIIYGFIYTNGQFLNLNTLMDPASGIVLEHATDINDAGQIVGIGRLGGRWRKYSLHSADSDRCFAWRRSPQTSTLAMFLGLGGMGLVAAWRRRKRERGHRHFCGRTEYETLDGWISSPGVLRGSG